MVRILREGGGGEFVVPFDIRGTFDTRIANVAGDGSQNQKPVHKDSTITKRNKR